MAGSLRDEVRRNLTFWGMVGVVMTALKLKENIDDYRQLSTEDREGRVALHSPVDEESTPFRDGDLETASTIDTEIPGARPKRKRDCCVCCGLRCGLFWKAFGIVCLIFLTWNAIKLAMWAAKPTPTGLEDMPAYSESLGCQNAPYFFDGLETRTEIVALNPSKQDHSVDVRGGAVGTLLLTRGSPESTAVRYEMTLRADNSDLATKFVITNPSDEEIEEGTSSSQLKLVTPSFIDAGSCMRYDVTMFIPPTIKKLHVSAHATTQIRFDPDADLEIDSFFVTTFSNDPKTMVLPTEKMRGKTTRLEMIRGWLVGSVSVVEKSQIYTQRGDAVANVHVKPAAFLPGSDNDEPKKAIFESITGAGRTDLFWESDKGTPHRQIEAVHRSSRNGDIYLTYKQSEFSGKVTLDAKSYSATGLQGTMDKNPDGTERQPWVGDENGKDTLAVHSRGWVGLYF
ncbi:hypothetical protein K474DRAFT_1636080 [Panus rudis PR-1116 ss-1]|nr:hypothetical protein K474DRAFT_1636080 [Panus rudis PR-1116 ss-1]